MPRTKRLSRVGNSAGLTFDQPILKQVGWEIGTEVEIKVEADQLVLRAYRQASADDVSASARRMMRRHAKSLDKLGR